MRKEKRLIYVILLNLSIVIIQIIFGLISHSLALITDALHNLEDVGSLILSFVAIRITKKKPSKKMTFGYKRAEIVAALINSSFLIIILSFVIYQAIKRLLTGGEVNSLYVIYVGLFAFIFNSLSVFLLKEGHMGHLEKHKEDLNIKAATLHLLSDAGISLGVVVGGILMFYFKANWIDPIISIVFSSYIIIEGFRILKKGFLIIMEAAPEEIDIESVAYKLKREIPEILEMHDIHVWVLSSEETLFSAHVVLKENLNMDTIEKIIEKIRKLLKEMGFTHITIQPETQKYKTNNILCNSH